MGEGAKRAARELYPPWNQPKRRKNIQRTAVCGLVTTSAVCFTFVLVLAIQQNQWSYGKCRLSAFPAPCHSCFLDPAYSCDAADDTRECLFEITATEEDGSKSTGLFAVPWEREYSTGEWRPKGEPFKHCPVEDSCCTWMTDYVRGRFCDSKAFKSGWPCRFKPHRGSARGIEYYIDPNVLPSITVIGLSAAVAALVVFNDPLKLNRKPQAQVEDDPPPPKARKLRIVAPEAPESPKPEPESPSSPLGKRWTPSAAAAALRPILSPLARRPGSSPPKRKVEAPKERRHRRNTDITLDQWDVAPRPQRAQSALALHDAMLARREPAPQRKTSVHVARGPRRDSFANWGAGVHRSAAISRIGLPT